MIENNIAIDRGELGAKSGRGLHAYPDLEGAGQGLWLGAAAPSRQP